MNKQSTSKPTEFTSRDYYEALGVDRGASPEEVDRAYIKHSLRYHPDQYKDSREKHEAERQFTHVSEAYQALSDLDRRKKYDEFLNQNPPEKEQPKQQKQAEGQANHPHFHYFRMVPYTPLTPFAFFDSFLSRGFFDDFDPFLYGLNRPQLGFFGRDEEDFFADDDFKKFLKEGKKGTFQKSKEVRKNTRIENGKRVTVTEVKSVDPEGNIHREIKEETDDGKGNRQVRYLDALPDERRKELESHPKGLKEDPTSKNQAKPKAQQQGN